MANPEDYKDDPSMGPCIVCRRTGGELKLHHTACECEIGDCPNFICDDCRMAGGNWAWIEGLHEDDTREVHIDCYHRMASAKNRHKVERQKPMGCQQ